MDNKRGQGLSTNAIILIILGVIILAVLIIGFTIGWGAIAPWVSADNVDKIMNQCEIACSTNSIYDFCSKSRELRDGKLRITTSCLIFSGIEDLRNKYGIDSCSSISCTLNCGDIKIEEKFGRKLNSIQASVPEDNADCNEEKEFELTTLVKVNEGESCCTDGKFTFLTS